MKLVYLGKEIECKECKSFWSRFRGFMLKKRIDTSLLFNHCNSIHTFFMRQAIDVILCDSENTILYYYRNLRPNKIIWPKPGVMRVYELPVGYFDVQIQKKLEVRE